MSIVFRETVPETTSWQCPPFEAPAEQRAGYVEDQIQEGEGVISGSRAYKTFGQCFQLFNGIFKDKTKSTLITNYAKYNIRKFVETLAEIREIGTYGSDASQFKSYAEMMNKVLKCIYMESQYPRQLRQVLQWAAVGGVAYLWPKCKADDYGFGERKIVFEPLGLFDLLPVQVPKTNDVQDAYINTIYEYMPIAEAHGRFPGFQDRLQPVDNMRCPSRITAKRLDYNEKFRYGDQSRNWGSLYCEIRYTFIRDLRINNLGVEIPMGEQGTTWFYKVPFVGQEIFSHIENGLPKTRKAHAEDCRVYPQLRLIITSPSIDIPMYDGPAFDWDGKMPAIQYSVDDWPWEQIGGSLIESVGSIEATKRKHERQMDQVLTTKKNPPLGYDRTATQGPTVENFDIFEQNQRAGMDGKPKDILQSLLPEEVRVEEVDFKFVEYLKSVEEQQLGINDLGSLVNMKLNVSSDSFDKALESIGPIAKGIAATMEASNAKVAYRLKFLIPQYIDTKRIIEYIGPDNITPETSDFDPATLVPSHMPDEMLGKLYPFDEINGQKIPRPSQYDKLQRAKLFARNLRLISVPSTLLKITQLQEQTKFLAIKGRGAPISWHTVMKKLGVENYGEIPGATEFEKWVNEEKAMLAIKAMAMKLGAELGIADPGQPSGKQHAGGRPPSDAKPPKNKLKDKNSGAPRPVTSTSG